MIRTGKLQGVELIYAGTFFPANLGGESITFTNDDIQAIYAATRAYIDATSDCPYIKLDHGEAGSSFPEWIGTLSLGTVSDLRVGTVVKGGVGVACLYADFENVPDQVLDLIRTGLAGKRSVELRTREGYGLVLDAVAFFGAGQPAVKALNGLASAIAATERRGDNLRPLVAAQEGQEKLYKINLQEEKTDNEGGQNTMAEIDYKAEYDKMVKKCEELEAKLAKYEAATDASEGASAARVELAELRTQREALETTVVKLREQVAAYDLLREQEEDKRVSDFIESAIAAGKLEPAKRDATTQLFKDNRDKPESLQTLRDLLDSKASQFSEKVPSKVVADPNDKARVAEAAKMLCKERGLTASPDNMIAAIKEITKGAN